MASKRNGFSDPAVASRAGKKGGSAPHPNGHGNAHRFREDDPATRAAASKAGKASVAAKRMRKIEESREPENLNDPNHIRNRPYGRSFP